MVCVCVRVPVYECVDVCMLVYPCTCVQVCLCVGGVPVY